MSEKESTPEKSKKKDKEKQEDKPVEEQKAEIPKTAYGPPPEPQFSHLVETFAVQALIYLGKIINPITNKYEQDHLMARYQIGILEILDAKTKGNLSPDEEKLLSELLHQTRMAYFDVTRKQTDEKP